jgi:hypothetical protein
MGDEHGEVGDVREVDMIDSEAVAIFDQNAVVEKEAREARTGRRHRHGLSERLAIAVNGEICEMDAKAAFATDDGSSTKVGSGV